MFKDTSATAIPATTYTLKSNVAYYAYDTQYAWSLGLTLTFAVV